MLPNKTQSSIGLNRMMDKRRWIKNRFSKGFTLIEVIVALAILGIGLTVIIELFSGGLRLAKTSEEYTKAINYARMKMEEITSKPKIEEGSEEGEFDDKFRWEVGVKKVDVLPTERNTEFKPPVEIYQVKVSVLWKAGSKSSQDRSTSVETYKTVKSGTDEKKS